MVNNSECTRAGAIDALSYIEKKLGRDMFYPVMSGLGPRDLTYSTACSRNTTVMLHSPINSVLSLAAHLKSLKITPENVFETISTCGYRPAGRSLRESLAPKMLPAVNTMYD
jgi:hypothetical protein